MKLTETIKEEYASITETTVKTLKNNSSVDKIIKSFENALEEGKRNYLLTSSNFLDSVEESNISQEKKEEFFNEYFTPFLQNTFSRQDITVFSLAAQEYSEHESFSDIIGFFFNRTYSIS